MGLSIDQVLPARTTPCEDQGRRV